jgi:hypothetical protein
MRAAFALLFIFAAVVPVSGEANNSEEILRQRLLLRERFNKGWDIQVENPKDREARCKAEAMKRYSAMHFRKRQKFLKACLAGASR